ncbi:MAG: DUF4282 domain-containing protein [Oscillospiraceae bacterium]|nr:DUF4282 domain-containing protein [Oscillospiraceae bacterium]
MSKKGKIKDFFCFKSLITETILRYVFIALVALATLGSIVGILASWVSAAAMMRYNFFMALLTFVGVPILIVIALALYVVFMRIGFEAILVQFLLYREVKQINDKK